MTLIAEPIAIALVSCLVTFFITTISQRSALEKIVDKKCANCLTKANAEESKQNIDALFKEVRAIRTATIFLVTQAGGDLRELGLTN